MSRRRDDDLTKIEQFRLTQPQRPGERAPKTVRTWKCRAAAAFTDGLQAAKVAAWLDAYPDTNDSWQALSARLDENIVFIYAQREYASTNATNLTKLIHRAATEVDAEFARDDTVADQPVLLEVE